ncbi:MAG: sugar phosphate isomerase/epimerase family protein [Lautropia sp.]
MRYELAINTFPYLWRGDVESALDDLLARGYRHFEIQLSAPYCWPPSLDPGVRRRIGARIARGDFAISSLNVGGFDNNLASPAPDVRARTVELIAATAALGSEWGVRGLVLSPGAARPLLPPPEPLLHGWLRDSLERLLPEAERHGVDLLLENIPYSFLPRADGIGSLLDAVAHPRLGAIYDVANAFYVREPLAQGFERLRSHLRLVHFSDTTLDVWRHDRLGAGIVPFDQALSSMRAVGYAGAIVLEIISDNFGDAIDDSVRAMARLDPA